MRYKKTTGLLASCLFLLFGLAHAGATMGADASAETAGNDGFRIKKSDIAVPEDVPVGKYRRMVQPFENWILICDDNLKQNTRTCNVSQEMIDAEGHTFFSWSLAARKNSAPVFILRVPARYGVGALVQIDVGDKSKPVRAATSACDDNICISFVNVGRSLRKRIVEGNDVSIRIFRGKSDFIDIRTTFRGLNDALNHI